MKNADFVTASEIAEYVYCKRAWWLRVSKTVTTQTVEMLEGSRKHNELSKSLDDYTSYKRLAIALLAAGLIGFLIFLLIYFFLK